MQRGKTVAVMANVGAAGTTAMTTVSRANGRSQKLCTFLSEYDCILMSGHKLATRTPDSMAWPQLSTRPTPLTASLSTQSTHRTPPSTAPPCPFPQDRRTPLRVTWQEYAKLFNLNENLYAEKYSERSQGVHQPTATSEKKKRNLEKIMVRTVKEFATHKIPSTAIPFLFTICHKTMEWLHLILK